MPTPPGPQVSYPWLSGIQDYHTAAAVRNLQDQVANLKNLSLGPIYGTLSPDTKPKLTAQQAGTLFFAQDFNRVYTWTGSAWTDAPGQPHRNIQALVQPTLTPVPQAGWLLCNGSTGLASTPTGATAFYTTPNIPAINGALTWVRV